MPLKNPVDTYKNLGVPRYGETEVRQLSTADVVTMTHSTANAGRFITFRDNIAEGSTLATQDLSWIGADGSFSGPLVNIVSPTTGANYQITSTQSGTLFNCGINNGTSQLLLLPVNPVPGFWFKVFVSTQDAVGDVQINSTADSSAKIVMPGMTSAISTGDAITPASTFGQHSVTMTAISSVLWLAEPNGQIVSGFTTAAPSADEVLSGVWAPGSTA